ncbi:MAG: hypothetical protein CMH79_06210 [Nitrospinae bacterium]|nr:hypothetical protein [Nitrospinota bacterium]
MNKIDTLLFSGGGLKCISFLGALKYLFETSILKENFEGIKDIYYVSGSSVFTLPLLIGYSINASIEIFKNIQYSNIFEEKPFDLNYLLTSYGLRDIDSFKCIVEIILEKKGIDKNITLKDFYKLTKINTYYKVVNITKGKIEYLNHIDNPNLSVSLAMMMTCCVPIVFSPIEYNGSSYIDGGVTGNFPTEKINKSPNYLGIDIISTKIELPEGIHIEDDDGDINIENIQEYIGFIYSILNISTGQRKSSRNIKLLIKGTSGINFESYEDNLADLINRGYNQTKGYIKSCSS